MAAPAVDGALQLRRRRAPRPAPRRPAPRASVSERASSPSLERADDQQDGVGARDDRFEHLVARDDEVLAQQRQLDGAR